MPSLMPLVSRHVFMNSIYEHFIFQSGFVDFYFLFFEDGLDVVLELCVFADSLIQKVIFMDSAKGENFTHFCPHFFPLQYATQMNVLFSPEKTGSLFHLTFTD